MEESTLTVDKLFAVARMLDDVPSDPLGGAQMLYAAENMLDDARKLAATYENTFRRAPLVVRSKLVPPGHIIGMAGSKVTCVITP